MNKFSNKIIIESLPMLTGFDDIVREVRLSGTLVYWLTKADAEGKYKVFYVKKQDGTLRTIHAPAWSVKIFQRWILENILYKVKTSQYSYGFEKGIRKGSPLVQCAEKHKNNLYILKMDLKNFYPSISRERVFYTFTEIGYNDKVSDLLTNACVHDDSLPQGAVTSAYLANIICRKLDVRIAGYCNKRNIVYTRYADDLTFSCDDRDLLKKIYGTVKKIIESEGFVLNTKKTVFMTPKNHKRVLGITLNDNVIKAPKELKRLVRAILHYQVITGDYLLKEKVRGYIAYIDSIEKNYKKKCMDYLIKLSKSDLCLFPEVVSAYNENKVFADLPDMILKKPTDFVKYEEAEEFEGEIMWLRHEYLVKHGIIPEEKYDNIMEDDIWG